MNDIPTTADRSPAGEARRAEYAKIKDDPLYKNNPSGLSAQAANVYAGVPPVTVKLGENLSLSAGGSDEKSGSPTRDPGAVSPEDAAADAAAASQLTSAELADAHEGANALTQRLGIAAARDLIGAYLEEGGDRKAGYKALAKFARATRP